MKELDWDALVTKGWQRVNDEARLVRYFADLSEQYPGSSRAHFELAGALDYCGHEQEAIPHYEEALRLSGLTSELRIFCLIQLGSSLRNVGRIDDAIDVLAAAEREYPHHWAASLFLGLALYSADRPRDALRTVMRATLHHGQTGDLERYRRSLSHYLEEIASE